MKSRTPEAFAWVTAALVMLGAGMTAQAGTIYVTPNGTGAGTPSWANATSLTNALAIATASDQIWLAQGTYTNDATFTVPADRVLYGGFTNGMATLGERDWEAYPALLDGQGLSRGIVSITGGGVTLDGLVISNATCGVDQYNNGSGAIDKRVSGTLTLRNCRITNISNAGRYYRGLAAFLTAGSVSISNSVIANITKTARDTSLGSVAVRADGVDLEIVDCVFTNNGAPGYDGIPATDLYFNNGVLRVTGTEFVNGALGQGVSGGAVYLDNNAATVASFSNCVFRGNQRASSGKGGAIWAQLHANATGTVVNCTFTDNGRDNLSGFGGAIYLSSGTLNVKNSIFWDNFVSAGSPNGQEIYVEGGTLNLSHSLLTGTDSPYITASPGATVNIVGGISGLDPLFASATDLRLQSPAGRWDPGTEAFVTDDTVYSPAIDAGDPDDPIGDEPTDNDNTRINLGVYGGTAQASKSPPAVAPQLADRDARVYFDRAEISGELTNTAFVAADVYLVYGDNDPGGGDTTNGWDTVVAFGLQHTNAAFSAWTEALAPSTTHYYRWYAVNKTGSDWTAVDTFVTGTAPASGGANVIHVDSTATSGANDGSDWANAYLNVLPATLDVSGSRTNVWITGATYSEAGTIPLAANTTMLGGFEGGETAASQRALTNAQGVVTNYTVFNGQGLSRTIVNITGSAVTLEAVAVSNSTVLGINKAVAGALTLDNCHIVNNVTAIRNQHGVGAKFTAGSIVMTNCVVAHNEQTNRDSQGLGIHSVGANLTVVDCVFTNNIGNGKDGVWATDIYFNNGTLDVRNTKFLDGDLGHGSFSGGAIYLGDTAATAATFRNCIFRGNQRASSGTGGAIWAVLHANATAEIINCTFTDNGRNHVSGFGGAIYLSSGTLNIKNSIFWDNFVSSGSPNGQEIYNAAGTLNVSYSLLPGTGAPYIAGEGNFSNMRTGDPLFASVTDVRLKSIAGRWDPVGQDWVIDAVHSPGIDGGDPADPIGDEPLDNDNARINMGAYGGTAQASKSAPASPPQIADRGAEVIFHRARISAELTNDTAITADVYLCYGTNNIVDDVTNGWGTVTHVGEMTDGDGEFARFTVALLPQTTYYYRWLATNNDGDDWTPADSFQTGDVAPGGGSDVIHVDSAATGAADGTDWAHAYTTIAAGFGDIGGTRTNIWIAGGTYSEGAVLTLAAAATVIGGFDGTETDMAERAQTNSLGVVTNYTRMNSGGSYSCVTITAAGAVWLDTMAFTNTVNARQLTKSGGGLLVMNNCRLEANNMPTGTSGARWLDGIGANFSAGSVIMTNCVVTGLNQGYRDNAGIGIYSANADLTIVDSRFIDNRADGFNVSAGAIAFENGTLQVARTEFRDNSVAGGDTASYGGGAIRLTGTTTATFVNCLFVGNRMKLGSAAGFGGAVWANLTDGYTVDFVNCTFAANTNAAGRGGAIYVTQGDVTLKNSILWTNAVTRVGYEEGSEIYADGANSSITVTYSLLTGTNTPHVVTAGGATVDWGTGILVDDPLFAGATDVHLQSKAGRWDPVAQDWVSDAVTSPAIDAGDPADPAGDEPKWNGRRINLGFYGGSWQASKSSMSSTLFIVR